MDMEELKSLFRNHGGWTVHMHKRNKGTQYVYASRKREGKVQKVYIAPLSKVDQLEQDQVIEKLELVKK